MKLYRAPFSTNVERVALALAHKGLSAEPVWIEYSDRSEVERVSGQALVPVLVDGDEVVADSMRILRYLEDRHPEPALYPADRARREEMLVFIDWFNHVWKVWPNSIEAGQEIDECSAAMARSLDRFESMLDGRAHLMGDDFSAADVAAFPFLKYALLRNPDDDEPFHLILEEHQRLDGARHARLADWIQRVNERPRA
jgi:glutathione S-transferase